MFSLNFCGALFASKGISALLVHRTNGQGPQSWRDSRLISKSSHLGFGTTVGCGRPVASCPNSLTILMMCITYGNHEDGEAPLETPGVLGRLAQSACCWGVRKTSGWWKIDSCTHHVKLENVMSRCHPRCWHRYSTPQKVTLGLHQHRFGLHLLFHRSMGLCGSIKQNSWKWNVCHLNLVKSFHFSWWLATKHTVRPWKPMLLVKHPMLGVFDCHIYWPQKKVRS